MPSIAGYFGLGAGLTTTGIFSEITGGGYVRQAAVLTVDAVSGVLLFPGVTFGPSTGAGWAQPGAVGFFDTAGNLLFQFSPPNLVGGLGRTFQVQGSRVQLRASVLAEAANGMVPANTLLGNVLQPLANGRLDPVFSGVSWKVQPGLVISALGVSVPLTYAATLTPNASAGNTFVVTLTGNLTLNPPTNMVAGTTYQIKLTQDASGSRTLTLGAGFNTEGGPPVLSTAANAVDVYSWFFDGTTCYGRLAKAFA